MEIKETSRYRMWNVLLWTAQLLLAAMFFMMGFSKIAMPMGQLSKTVDWVLDVPAPLVRFIGFAEFLGATGLLLPSLLRIKPLLTAWAAVGILIIMFLAMLFNISRAEFHVLPVNLFFGLIALFIAWGRFKKAPIPERERAY